MLDPKPGVITRATKFVTKNEQEEMVLATFRLPGLDRYYHAAASESVSASVRRQAVADLAPVRTSRRATACRTLGYLG